MSGKTVRALAVGVLGIAAVLSLVLWRGHYRRQHRAIYPEAMHKIVTSLPTPFSRLLMSIHNHEPQMGTDGAMHGLQPADGVTAPDGAYMYELARKLKPHQTAEVGFAEGFSTMYFLAAIKANGSGFHVAIDPFEIRDYHGIGLQKVAEAEMKDRFRFMDAKSIAALPALSAEKSSFEIIFIDGDHRFDAAFTDFIMSDQICPKGGYILLHDAWLDSTKKIISFVERNRSDYARRAVPTGVNVAAFEKIGEDRRDWTHFVNF